MERTQHAAMQSSHKQIKIIAQGPGGIHALIKSRNDQLHPRLADTDISGIGSAIAMMGEACDFFAGWATRLQLYNMECGPVNLLP